VAYGERLIIVKPQASAAMMNTAPKMLTRENVFVLGWKTWGMLDFFDATLRGGARKMQPS